MPVCRRLLFTSKLFAAHIAPAAAGAEPGDAGDDAGWGVYGPEWRFYYDCMLAPVARQAAGVLDVCAEMRLSQMCRLQISGKGWVGRA